MYSDSVQPPATRGIQADASQAIHSRPASRASSRSRARPLADATAVAVGATEEKQLLSRLKDTLQKVTPADLQAALKTARGISAGRSLPATRVPSIDTGETSARGSSSSRSSVDRTSSRSRSGSIESIASRTSSPEPEAGKDQSTPEPLLSRTLDSGTLLPSISADTGQAEPFL